MSNSIQVQSSANYLGGVPCTFRRYEELSDSCGYVYVLTEQTDRKNYRFGQSFYTGEGGYFMGTGGMVSDGALTYKEQVKKWIDTLEEHIKNQEI